MRNARLDTDDSLSSERLLDRFQGLLQTRRLYEVVWQDIANLMIPRKNDIIVRKAPGVRRTEKLFESTAIFAGELLAASLHGTLTSSYNPWFSLILDDPKYEDDEEVQSWLDICKEDMRLAFNRSNFAQESHEGYLDLVYFGTMALLFEDRTDEGKAGDFRFTATQVQNYAIAEDAMGRVDTVFRSIPMSKAAIRERWLEAVRDIPEFDPAGKGRDLDTLCEVIHAVVPRNVKKPSLLNPAWASIYLLAKEKTRLEIKPFHEFPYMVPRWTKISGETYGRGRGHTSLPDVKSLNKLVELELRALGKQVDPPMAVKGGDVVGHPRLQRGGLTTIRDKESLFPLLPPIDFKPSNLKTQQLMESVRKMFYADQLQMPQEGPQMTATEANIRYELMQRILGPTLGRLESEFLSPLIARGFRIRMRAGKFPPVPAALLADKASKPTISVGYQGPLARAQRAGEISAVQQLISIAEPLLQAKPDVLDNVDVDRLFAHTALTLGISPQYIIPEKAVQDMRQQRAQAQQQQQNQENQANALKSAAPMVAALHKSPEPGSAAEKMMGGGQNGTPTPQQGPPTNQQ